VSSILRYLILLILLNNCSLDTKTGIWSDKKDLILLEDVNSTKIFTKDEPLEKEFNPNLQIKLTSKLIENSFVNNLTNNNGRINYEGKLKKISKFKFSKINNFENSEPELIFENDNLIFFDNKGSIIKFNPDSNIIWKKNYYDKSEKKLRPILTFGQSSDTLIVADNTSKYYALNLENGKLLWSKYNSSPFNSQIKTYKDRFFVIDFNNILRCISVKDGTELWNIKTSNTFIKSQKKLSIVVVNNVIYFNNSTGDITAVDTNSGAMLWQTPTQNSTIYEDTFLLKTSNIVAGNNMIIFSNNKNEFYSIDLVNGNLKWKQKINSSIQPTIINDLIFTITNEGYLIIIDSNIGNIIKVTDIFSLIKQKKRNKINPVGFVVAKKNIYLSTDHGRLFIIDIASGKTKSIIKIDKNKISRPFILNKNLFLIKEDSIIKLN
jgi:outer membrane protein assembly factor BamB